MDPRLSALRKNYQPPASVGAEPRGIYDTPTVQRHLMMRTPCETQRDHRRYVVDTLFPLTATGLTDTAGTDEGTADLLYGLVRALQPLVVLETGTHKGRSTRAIATALRDNTEVELVAHAYTAHLGLHAQLYTIDAEDHQIFESGALPESAKPYVTHIVGWTPDVLTANPHLQKLEGIEFAFLDGDHTPEGLAAELAYLDAHRAAECWVAVDNTRDDGWPKLREFLTGYTQYPRLSLGTCTGMDLIWMSGARSPRVENASGGAG